MATITIPAEYLENACQAIVGEIDHDAGALRTTDNPVDRNSAALVLRRDLRLLDALLNATGDVELTAESDNTSSPLFNLLEGMVRQVTERLAAAVEFEPVPMGTVVDLVERLRWAAAEAIRMEPDRDRRLSAKDWEMVA